MRLLAAILLLYFAPRSSAIITYGTGDPAHNTNAPTGALAQSGWELGGQWGVYTGWPIAPQYFVTCTHVGGTIGDSIIVNGVSYTTTAHWTTVLDISLWKISGSFPTWARVYQNTNELGKTAVMIGRGTQRDSVVTSACPVITIPCGWTWGTADTVMRWGTNVVSFSGPVDVWMKFTNTGGDDMASISDGDSGGGAFIQDSSFWKLDALIASPGGNTKAVYLDNCTEFQSVAECLPLRFVWSDILTHTGAIPDPPATTLGVHVEAAHLEGFHFGP